MSFKSEAHKRKIFELVQKGKLKATIITEWGAKTPKDKKLPERLKPKKKK